MLLLTATEEEVLQNKYTVTLYPNPVDDILTIRHDYDAQLRYADVYDLHGRLIKRYDMTQGKSNIHLNPLVKGLYVLRLEWEDDTTYTTKFIKL
ncbi:MAG: T9SS type A sorting domain-containing protein [Bacteroidota bacterium]